MVIEVHSDRVKYSEEYIETEYSYQTTAVNKEGASVKCYPQTKEFVFRTTRKVPKTCLALVGWGGKQFFTRVIASDRVNKKERPPYIIWKPQ